MPGQLTAYLLTLVVTSIPVAMVATTVATTKVFRGLRYRVCVWSTWLGDLVACPYCLGVWLAVPVAFCAVSVLAPAVGWPWQEAVLAGCVLWSSLSFVAGILSGLLCWALARMDALHGGGE